MRSHPKNSTEKIRNSILALTALLALPATQAATNTWNGLGVGANTGSIWDNGANYLGGSAIFSSANDMDFSTITNPGAGITLSAAGGTYDVKSLLFGTAGSSLASVEALAFNGSGTPGATVLNLAGGIALPKFNGSVVTLGSDLTLNLSNGAHSVSSTAGTAVLIVNSLVTGGGAAASFTNANTSAPMILTNNSNSFTNGGLSGSRYNGYVGFTSVANVGSGNSSLGNASTAANGLLWMSNSSVLDYIGVGDQTTDRAVRLDGTVSFNNSAVGTAITYNGLFTPNGVAGAEVRSAVIGGSTVVIDSVISGNLGLRRQTATTYSPTTGAASTNDGTGTLVLGGANTHSGSNLLNIGTTKITNVSALGFGGLQTTTAGNTQIATGAVLDLNGQSNVNEPIQLAGGSLLNNSTTAASIGTGIAASTVAGATGSGSGYSSAPTVTVDGTGSGATATASLGVTAASFSLSFGDRVYTVAPTVTITGGTGGNGSGPAATATAILSGGSTGTVIGINITNAGTGFTTAPTITFSGGTSTGTTTTTGVGNATNFTVSGLTMTSAGSGYTGTPTYTFTGGGGSGATATATLSSIVLTANANNIGGSGDLAINAAISQTGSPRAITKVGAGTLTLAGANTYTGGTTVSVGTLLVNGNQSAATGAVTVSAGATLGGSGIVGGATTISAGGLLSAGNSPGTLTFASNLSLAGGAGSLGSTAIFEGGDLVVVNGTLTLNTDWNLTLTTGFQDGGAMTLFTYTTAGGTLDLTPDIDISGLGFTPTGSLFLTDTGSAIVLNGISVVPEPGTCLLLAAGVAVMALRRRR